MKYQLIDNINKLEDVKDKNIIFLFERIDFIDLFHCCQTLFKSPPASFILVTENAYAINDSLLDKVNPYHTMAVLFGKALKMSLSSIETIPSISTQKIL